jgi:hypothetical protein
MAKAACKSTGTRIMLWIAPLMKRSTRGHLELGSVLELNSIRLVHADLRGFILVEYFIGYDFVRMFLIAPGTGVRGPGLIMGDSNLIFPGIDISEGKGSPVSSISN